MPPVISGDLAYPIFCTRNWLSQDTIRYGTFSSTEMSSLLSRVLDGDRFSYFQGDVASDLTTLTIEMSFQNRTASIFRSFNLVILQNINWKNFLGQYFDETTETWTTITGLDFQVSNNTSEDLIVALPASVSGNAVRFTVTTTMTANAYKKVGNIMVCESVLQLSGGFQDYKPGYDENVNRLKMGNGVQSLEYYERAAGGYELWKASFDAPYATLAELKSLRSIKRGGLPVILIPEPYLRPDEAYQCLFDGPWPGHAYINPVRSQGYLIPLRVKEVGRH
jgi:hypothetical protein